MIHLIKLCVGVASPAELARLHKRESPRTRRSHVTRMFPTRAPELLDGGSLYWVFSGFIQARQRLHALERTQRNGISCCRIVFDPKLVLTLSRPRRPFQGWRYLAPPDAPPDLNPADASALSRMPDDMRRELVELGLI